jgi:hypothetical protein
MQKENIPQLGFDFGDAHLPKLREILLVHFNDAIEKYTNPENWLGNIAFLVIDDDDLKQELLGHIDGAAVVDFDRLNNADALEYFYKSERGEGRFLFLGKIRNIEQPDLKSRFDNIIKFQLPELKQPEFDKIWNEWAKPRGIKNPKDAQKQFYQQINLNPVTLNKFFDFIDEYCKSGKILKNEDVEKIISGFGNKHIEQDIFDDT